MIVTLKNGERIAHREQINRGAADNPVSDADMTGKFMENAQMAVSRARAEAIRDTILELDRKPSALEIAELLSAPM